MPGALNGAGEAVNVVSGRVWRRPRRERQSGGTDEPVAEIVPSTQPSSSVGPPSFLFVERTFAGKSFSPGRYLTGIYRAPTLGSTPDDRSRSISTTVLRAVRPTPTKVADA